MIASQDQLFSLQALVDDTGLPKPTLHRMLQQLEGAGLLRREGDGRHYGTGVRLRRLAENLLLNDTLHGARHAVLRHLVDEVGESCNITALSGSEVIYLDRVETAGAAALLSAPGLARAGALLGQRQGVPGADEPAQRERLLATRRCSKYTAHTLTDTGRARERDRAGQARRLRAGQRGVPARPGVRGRARAAAEGGARARSNLCVALQAPVMRLSIDKALQLLPALQRAAEALGRIEAHADQGSPKAAPNAVER